MKGYDVKPGDKCPKCGTGILFDETKGEPGLSPTGGDFEYVVSNVVLDCPDCKAVIPTIYKCSYDIETKEFKYFKSE